MIFVIGKLYILVKYLFDISFPGYLIIMSRGAKIGHAITFASVNI
jgi:hypothetical protein